MVNIYVLKLENNKFYIGKTNNHVGIRFSQHKNDKSCSWTAKYPPVELLETIKSNDDLDEDKITKKYMMKYGIENVRGGSYTKVELDDWMIKSLEHEFTSVKDICYNCNERGHLYRNCDYKECPSNNKFNIKKYLEDFKEISSISIEIDKLDKVYEHIIILNHEINTTNIFNKENHNKKIELEKTLQEINEKLTLYQSNYRKYNTEQQEARKIQQELINKIAQFNSATDHYHINNIYRIYFTNNQIYMDSLSNTEIKKYKLEVFNIQKKKELKEILEIHTSEDIIKQKLSGLYEKKISMLI